MSVITTVQRSHSLEEFFMEICENTDSETIIRFLEQHSSDNLITESVVNFTIDGRKINALRVLHSKSPKFTSTIIQKYVEELSDYNNLFKSFIEWVCETENFGLKFTERSDVSLVSILCELGLHYPEGIQRFIAKFSNTANKSDLITDRLISFLTSNNKPTSLHILHQESPELTKELLQQCVHLQEFLFTMAKIHNNPLNVDLFKFIYEITGSIFEFSVSQWIHLIKRGDLELAQFIYENSTKIEEDTLVDAFEAVFSDRTVEIEKLVPTLTWMTSVNTRLVFHSHTHRGLNHFSYFVKPKPLIVNESKVVDKVLECSICSEKESEIITDCNHQYCHACLETWYQTCTQSQHDTSCPMCRQIPQMYNIKQESV